MRPGRAGRRIARGRARVAVGTTTVRVLETVRGAARRSQGAPAHDPPGRPFAATGALVTNFHLPRSTLLALVMAFAGVDRCAALPHAVAERYRFYSFGDAMLLQ